ncbi:TonB-dependent siderophore receptor, partial [Salmonella enterica]|nr:TonB-dependent siderophore receptor [Salmonella enterica]
EQGGVAPDEAVNRLQVLPPMRSKQRELGVKAELGGVLVSGALFDIEKSYEYSNNANVYVQDGIQRHRGAEVSAVGKVTDAWTVMGGVTLL